MALEGWYYLHENGDVIYKRELGETAADLRESDLVRMMWPFDPSDREGAWRIVVEALALGAIPDRVAGLAELWSCTNQDALVYATRIGALLNRDGDQWCATRKDFANLQESAAGFGATAREALSALAAELGLAASKMWGPTFRDLLASNGVEK